MKQKLFLVFLVSLVALFLESALIRWVPSHVRAISYFKNLILISSFLGFGLGFILKDRAGWLRVAFPVFLWAELGAALLLGQFLITGQENTNEDLWLLYFDLPRSAPTFPLVAAILLFYLLNTLTFIPMGQLLASKMGRVDDSLLAYVINVLGSVVGTLLFVGVSFLGLGPYFWFAPVLLIYAGLFWERREVVAVTLVALLLLFAVPVEKPDTIWSPYYALNVKLFLRPPAEGEEEGVPEHQVSVNGSFHQAILDFRESALKRSSRLSRGYAAYSAPYLYYQQMVKQPPQEVLVIGAGTGNDVVVALKQGAGHVDAVEIDPSILQLGVQLNPNQPYQDARVQPFVDDARSYLQTTDKKYDMVVFGTLDSQIALSALSTIRLDNYVYTRESLEQAKNVLKPGGMLVLYFRAQQEWIIYRLTHLVTEVFGQTPEIVVDGSSGLFNLVLLASDHPSFQPSQESEMFVQGLAQEEVNQIVPTDDWPYLYQREPIVSQFYLTEILVLIMLSLLALRVTLWPRLGAAPQSISGFHLPLFFQGMAFLFLETRSISILSLLFGATWLVSTLVIAAVLVVVMMANLFVRAYPFSNLRWPFVGLALTLALGYLFPTSLLLGQPFLLRLLGGVLVFISPIFFSSLIFAVLFRESTNIPWAYGSNLFGSVIGGFGEYIAVITGLRALNLIALLLFVPILFLHRDVQAQLLPGQPLVVEE